MEEYITRQSHFAEYFFAFWDDIPRKSTNGENLGNPGKLEEQTANSQNLSNEKNRKIPEKKQAGNLNFIFSGLQCMEMGLQFKNYFDILYMNVNSESLKPQI